MFLLVECNQILKLPSLNSRSCGAKSKHLTQIQKNAKQNNRTLSYKTPNNSGRNDLEFWMEISISSK